VEPFQGVVNFMHSYSAMQGIVHFIGWTIAIIILVYMFKFMKKHMQEDERAKKYQNKNILEELKKEEENSSSN
jgi:uncharacterized membrane protein YjfL (UPF0719 family)